MKVDMILYNSLLSDIKNRVRQGQLRAGLSANAGMLAAYWDIGKMIHKPQKLEGWGKGVIPRLANDLKNELAEVKGFSERNINSMMIFYRENHHLSILQLSVAKLDGNENLAQSATETASESNTKPAFLQSTDIKKSIGQRSVVQIENHPILPIPLEKTKNQIVQRSVAQLPDDKNSIRQFTGFRGN